MAEDLGVKVKKEENFSEWYDEVVSKSDLVDTRYGVQGFLIHKPWGIKTIKFIHSLFEEELEKQGHEPVLFPVVIPERNFEKEKEHVEGFSPEVFWITQGGENELEEKLALRPTSETAFYPSYSLWIRSWRDLPLKRYQSVPAYRYESKTKPFLRGREFLWIEAHDAFSSRKEAMEQIRKDKKTSKKVIEEELGIPVMQFRRPEWDKFAGAKDTYATDSFMPSGKFNQLPSTHDLGQNFARAFDIKFKDKDGKEDYAWQTCYGPGIWRIMASVIGIHGDDKGLVLPPSIVPYQTVMVPIYNEKNREEVMDKVRRIYEEIKNCARIYMDDRDHYTPGFKFNDWELKGVPVRIEIGMKELEKGKLTLVRRDNNEKITIDKKEFGKRIGEILDDISENMRKISKEFMKNKIKDGKTLEELKKIIHDEKSIARVNLCSRDRDGENCADVIQKETYGGKVRGDLIDKKEKPEGNCPVCGKKTTVVVYVGKDY